jgi:hypothetical protein
MLAASFPQDSHTGWRLRSWEAAPVKTSRSACMRDCGCQRDSYAASGPFQREGEAIGLYSFSDVKTVHGEHGSRDNIRLNKTWKSK